MPGTSELVLHAPVGPWAGESVEVVVDLGYIATAVGEGDREVLSQVAFRGGDLADMEPGTVYTNDTDSDVRKLVGRSADTSPPTCEAGDELRAGPRWRGMGDRVIVGY